LQRRSSLRSVAGGVAGAVLVALRPRWDGTRATTQNDCKLDATETELRSIFATGQCPVLRYNRALI
jgi:hypothetical protein